MTFKIVSVFILTFLSTNLFALDKKLTRNYKLGNQDYEYEKPGFFDFLDFDLFKESHSSFFKQAFSKDKLKPWAIIAASTAITYQYDEEILLESQRFGRRLGIGNEDNTKTVLSLGDTALLRLPTDLGSWMYFIGDGWTQFSILMGFYGYGKYTDNYKSLQVAKQISHGLVMTAIGVQVLKRSTGRESPYVRTQKRGKWVLLPSQKDYNKKVSTYDAFPSGHVTTATMVLTVISENYPDNPYVVPVGATLISLLSYQMLNNGVHWASDYPLAIGMGYLYGKVAAQYGRRKIDSNGNAIEDTSFILPMQGPDGGMGMKYVKFF